MIPASRQIAGAELEQSKTCCLELTIYSDGGGEVCIYTHLSLSLHPMLRQQFFRSATSITKHDSYSPLFPWLVDVFAVLAMVRFAPLAPQNRKVPSDFSQIQDTHTDGMPLVSVYYHPKKDDVKTTDNFIFFVLNTGKNHSLFNTTSHGFPPLFFWFLHRFFCDLQFLIYPD